MKKIRWIMMGFIVLFIMQGVMAQGSSSSDDEGIMLTSSDINGVGQDNKDRMLLSDLLSALEKHFDVTFLYKDELVMNKYIFKDEIKIGDETGRELSAILDQLGIAFQQIDEQTYVLLNKNISLQTARIQEEISGTVIDAQSGETLPGVNIAVKGTTAGTSTNHNGRYELSVPSLSDTLLFSFIGYQTQEIPINDRMEIDVALQSQAVTGEEVIVVGYGTQRKRDLTGSVSSVQAEDLETQGPQVNFIDALKGLAPGLNITQSENSASSGSINIQIRGQNSITASNNPLVILDGVPYEGGLNMIDQSSIESIEVLKDASSSAIYGARGANGVILITTKRGQIGEPNITYSGNVGIKQLYNIPDLLTGPEHWEFGIERYGESAITENYPTRVENYNNGVSTNWVDEATRLGTQQKHSIGVAGGTEWLRYFISGTFMDVRGISKGDNYENIQGRVNLTINPNDWLELGTNSQYTNEDNSGIGVDYSGDFSGVFWLNPLITPYDENGDIAVHPWPEMPNYSNPLSNLNIQNEDISKTLFSNNYIQIDFPFLAGLAYKLNTGVTYRSNGSDSFWGDNTLSGLSNAGRSVSAVNKTNNVLFENLLFYEQTFGNHRVDITGLYSTQKNVFDRSRIDTRGFPTAVLTWYQPGSGDLNIPARDYTKQTYISQMGRLFYSFKEKYLLTFTVRRDGYSAFGSQNKFGVFPSIALGWNIKSEKFFSDNSVLSELKLRASYGANGNQAISPYSTLAKVERMDFLTGVNGDEQGVGYIPNSLKNASLGWETTRSINLGVDYGFINNRITGAVDVYKSNTHDLLIEQSISSINGVTSIISNVGEVENSGIELITRTRNVVKNDFEWSSAFTISHNKNEIVELYGDNKDDIDNGWFIGHSIDVNFGYKYDGVWQLDDNIENSVQPNAKPGDVKIKDVNGDGVISADDRTFIGSTNPKYSIGFSNSLRYKNINFSFSIYGRQGVIRNNGLWSTDGVYADALRNTIKRNWWSEDNPTNDFPANRDGTNPFGVNFYKDASFIRVGNVSLVYSLGDRMLNSLGIQKLDFVFSLKNGFTFTKWDGLDPEFSSQRAAPMNRVYNFGININL